MSRLTTLTLDERGFAFDPATGTSYTLNPAAALLLGGLREGLDAEALVGRLIATFAIERERAVRDLAAFTHDLTSLGLV